MILGALLDSGLDVGSLRSELEGLGLNGFSLGTKNEVKKSDRCTQADVVVHDHAKVESRGLSDITSLITGSRLPDKIKSDALKIFNRLGEAEAFVHQVPIEDVHFHEVGAIDAIVDIVGAVIGLNQLGIQKIHCSPINLGGGFVKTAHGILPAPAPATLELIKGFPTYSTGMVGELLTPTGAAILSTLASGFGPLPAMTIGSIGYGAGKMELENPNVLRLVIGETDVIADQSTPVQVAVIETNIDDMNPQIYDSILQKAFDKGALDVALTNIQMKKNRPGVQLQIICPLSEISALSELVLNETTSIGLRWRIENRIVAQRSLEEIVTQFGKTRVKIAYLNGRLINVSPEYDDCSKLASDNDVPVKLVMMAACQKASELFARSGKDEN